MEGEGLIYSAADVAWVVVQGFGWVLFGRKKRWGGPVEIYTRSTVPMEAIYGLTLGVGGVFFYFLGRKGRDIFCCRRRSGGGGTWGGLYFLGYFLVRPVGWFLGLLICFEMICAITLGVGVAFVLFFAVQTYLYVEVQTLFDALTPTTPPPSPLP